MVGQPAEGPNLHVGLDNDVFQVQALDLEPIQEMRVRHVKPRGPCCQIGAVRIRVILQGIHPHGEHLGPAVLQAHRLVDLGDSGEVGQLVEEVVHRLHSDAQSLFRVPCAQSQSEGARGIGPAE
eukprot:4412509-Alexandrium_andersonii.AAC.1